ncbi:hypothetical protein C1646_756361 [Rhizophagus diaphanus]|nr:hypothetical protein C1646_756361 [Rhizophagus diaphanus] [Rhizophagus sp. MUCL 43196]
MPPQKSQIKSKKNKKTFKYVASTKEEIKSMQTVAHSKATHNSTSTWINALETFRKDIGLLGKINDVNSKEELELRFAIAQHINTYSKFRPQEITNKNIYSELYNAITEIKKIINHLTMQPDSPKGLIRHIFWHNTFKLALQAKVILIPTDNTVIQDYELYFSKKLPICEDAFQFTCNLAIIMKFTGYWFKSIQIGEKLVKGLIKEIATITEIDCNKRKFTNHSGRKTFIQISKSEGISDNDQNTLSQINSLIYNDTLLPNDKTSNSFSSALEIFKGKI